MMPRILASEGLHAPSTQGRGPGGCGTVHFCPSGAPATCASVPSSMWAGSLHSTQGSPGRGCQGLCCLELGAHVCASQHQWCVKKRMCPMPSDIMDSSQGGFRVLF